ncbi:MAG: lipid A export permease/ATP-binding protein MsbA [Methylotenera sp.]|nr:lipid A export permease/ATP-binding protein MsbA [Methylotenera sp.]MDP1958535.1 lipid A export permease/ATP-binding protein MsbA [Methylotenera sp.]MDP3207366.1 lipid A export permease/ATP-binding protein MsbA [Methylotenera sp.]MDP3303212.1 lipid A export permease/ATP-binding protein MsbA [Methylotenera sp.]MDP3943070.1 lipid A export permease/ATP-binding protein MsbA [Methylotenera sp.]
MTKVRRNKQNLPEISNAKALYLRLFRYAWRYKYVFITSILSLVVLSASNTGFLALIKQVTDEGFVKKTTGQTVLLPLMIFGLMMIRGVAGYISVYTMRVVARRVVEDFRKEMFSKLMLLPVHYFDARSSGALVSKFTYDVERLSSATTRSWLNVLRDILTVVGLIAYMLYLDWRLTLVFATVLPFATLYIRKITPKLKANAKNVQFSMGEMTKSAEEAISGQRIVKIFGAQDFEYKRFADIATNNRRIELRLTRISGLSSFIVEMFAALALALVIYYAMGSFSVGEFAAFVGALLMLISPIKHIAAANEDFQVGLAAAQSIFEVMDAVPEQDEGKIEIKRAKGEIEFRNVTLRYENASGVALDNLSFNIKAGEKVALVGRSGGGKTTLVNLLPRFYELQQGLVLLDGVDVRAVKLRSLREQFALVSQDIVLFNDTIFNNIAYGVLRIATEDEVIAAAKAAHAWEFIQKLPDGLQNEIGDRGVRLSGGQRQRIAIARAILKNAPILLLDEATSALDTESEQHVQAALDTLMQNRTSIVIAHRLSTIENADRIMVMEHGKIIENGSHNELIKLDGHYAKLYRKQFS